MVKDLSQSYGLFLIIKDNLFTFFTKAPKKRIIFCLTNNKSTKSDVPLVDLSLPLLLTIISLKAICCFSISNMLFFYQ